VPKLKLKFSADFDRQALAVEKIMSVRTWTDKKIYSREVINSFIKPQPETIIQMTDNGYNDAIPLVNFEKDSNFFIEIGNLTQDQEFIFE
jgi:hypothetical protein